MSVIITNDNQIRQEKIDIAIRKMIAKSLIVNEPKSIEEQIKEMQSWSNDAMESLDRVLNRIPDTKDVVLK